MQAIRVRELNKSRLRLSRRTRLLLHEFANVDRGAFLFFLQALLLEFVIEKAQEQLGELLCVLLFSLIETERVGERCRVVNRLL